MLNAIIFGVTLVVANVLTTLILLKVMMSKTFLKKYTKWATELTNEILKEQFSKEEDL